MDAIDNVNHPRHYSSTQYLNMECIDIVKYMPFHIGNCIKYVWRAPYKGNYIEDLKKSKYYFDLYTSSYTLSLYNKLAIRLIGTKLEKYIYTDISIGYSNYNSITYSSSGKTYDFEYLTKGLLNSIICYSFNRTNSLFYTMSVENNLQNVLRWYDKAMMIDTNV